MSDDFLKHVKEVVTIFRPMPSVEARGPNSSRENQPTITIRFREGQVEKVQAAADLLGVKRSYFIGWCAHQVAIEILRQYEEYKNRRR